MTKTFSTEKKVEKAILVAIVNKQQTAEKATEYLDELAFLAETSGLKSVKYFTQKMDKPDIKSFVGKGKLEEIIAYVKEYEIDVVIFDDDLTPSQLRNLEKVLQVKIYDRSLLILDIFLQRAQTAQARVQVELARYQYLMPRLTRMWTHLERQRGGTGTRGGAGEKEIETDRRMIRNQIALLKEKLKKIEKQGETQRKSRSNIVRVALVGYTNVGKSTLMRLLTNADVLAENKLFATVDSTVRKVVFNQVPFLLSDTVGFIRKLPHHLIEAFKSTLAEVKEADILLHVIDISHPSFAEQAEIVNDTLKDLGATDKSTVLVFNKIDMVPQEDIEIEGKGELELEGDEVYNELTHRKIQSNYLAKEGDGTAYISAVNKINIEDLKDILFKKIEGKHLTIFPNYLRQEAFKGETQGSGFEG